MFWEHENARASLRFWDLFVREAFCWAAHFLVCTRPSNIFPKNNNPRQNFPFYLYDWQITTHLWFDVLESCWTWEFWIFRGGTGTCISLTRRRLSFANVGFLLTISNFEFSFFNRKYWKSFPIFSVSCSISKDFHAQYDVSGINWFVRPQDQQVYKKAYFWFSGKSLKNTRTITLSRTQHKILHNNIQEDPDWHQTPNST